MDTGILILIIFLVLSSALLILSFAGPEDRKSGFWYWIQKIRSEMDFFFYWVMNFFAIGALLLVMIYLIGHFLLNRI